MKLQLYLFERYFEQNKKYTYYADGIHIPPDQIVQFYEKIPSYYHRELNDNIPDRTLISMSKNVTMDIIEKHIDKRGNEFFRQTRYEVISS